jgi:TRAP-type mannitol/chloroaromatic compound transport system substrate-binding protein
MAKSTTTVLIAGVALAAGLAGGYGAIWLIPMPSPSDTTSDKIETAASAPEPKSEHTSVDRSAEGPAIKWRMISTYQSDLPVLGTLGKRLGDAVRTASGQALDITFYEPDILMPPLEGFNAVAQGKIDAVWGSSAYWVDTIPAAQWFAGTPFGPRAEGLLAWLSYGGGQKLWDDIYAKHGVKALTCGVAPPDAAGWFREPIDTTDDLDGMNIRIFGYGALVIERLGANALRTPAADIAAGLTDGTLDGAEFSFPAIDAKAGFDRVAKYYYFPGWQQGTEMLELLVNKEAFDALPDKIKAALDLACSDNIRRGLAEGNALQAQALQQLSKKGVVISRLPDNVLRDLEAAWRDVVREKSAENVDFSRAAQSLTAFRRHYDDWEKIGYTQ